jgi:hypothetical protein
MLLLKSTLVSAHGLPSRTVYRYFSVQSFCTTAVVFVIVVVYSVIVVFLTVLRYEQAWFIGHGMYVPTDLQYSL